MPGIRVLPVGDPDTDGDTITGVRPRRVSLRDSLGDSQRDAEPHTDPDSNPNDTTRDRVSSHDPITITHTEPDTTTEGLPAGPVPVLAQHLA